MSKTISKNLRVALATFTLGLFCLLPLQSKTQNEQIHEEIDGNGGGSGVTCYSTYRGTLIAGWTIYRCSPSGPCQTVNAKDYKDPGKCQE